MPSIVQRLAAKKKKTVTACQKKDSRAAHSTVTRPVTAGTVNEGRLVEKIECLNRAQEVFLASEHRARRAVALGGGRGAELASSSTVQFADELAVVPHTVPQRSTPWLPTIETAAVSSDPAPNTKCIFKSATFFALSGLRP